MKKMLQFPAKMMCIGVLVLASSMNLFAQSEIVLDVWDSSRPYNLIYVGQIRAIQSAQTGEEHYDFDTDSKSGHPSCVDLQDRRLSSWIHQNTLNNEMSFGFIYEREGHYYSNSPSIHFRVVGSADQPYIGVADDAGEITESPAGSGAYYGAFRYSSPYTDGGVIGGITGDEWTVIVDGENFGRINQWYLTGGGVCDAQNPDFSSDIQLNNGYEYRITPAGHYPSLAPIIAGNLAVDAGPDHNLLCGESVQIGSSPSAIDGSEPYSYAWSPSEGLDDHLSPNPVASPLTTTTYTLTVTDFVGTVVTDQVTVNINDDVDPVLVLPADVTLEIGTATPIVTYTGPPATASDNCDPNPVVTSDPALPVSYDTPGVYTITWTATDIYNNSISSDQTITVNRAPLAVDAGPDQTIFCSESAVIGGSPTAFDGLAPYTYSWSPVVGLDDPASPNPVASPEFTTTYTVTVTDAEGTVQTDGVVVTIDDNEAPVVVCPADVPLQIVGSTSVTYSGPAAAASDNCDANPVVTSVPALPVTYNDAGVYTITWTATDAHGNSSSCAQTITVEFAPLVIDAGPDQTILCSETAALGGAPSAVNGKAPYTYSWSPVVGLDDPANPNPAASPGVTTTYTLTLTDAQGTVLTDDVVVTVSDTEAPVVVCPADVPLQIVGSTSVTYSGPAATAADNCDANPVVTSVPALPVTYNDAGVYTITWTATDAHGNSSSCDQTITVDFAPLVVDAGSDLTILCSESATLGGAPTAVNGKAPYTYVWSPAAGLDDPASPNPVANPGATTTYSLTVTDALGTVLSDDIVVRVDDSEAPVVTCPTDVTLDLTGISATVTYSGPPAAVSDNCDPNPVITSVPALPVSYNTAGVYTVTWTATDAHGNSSSCDQTITVTAFEELIVNAGPDKNILCDESAPLGGAPTAVAGKAPYTYLWSPAAGLDDPAASNPVANPGATETYTVTVTDAEGTVKSDDVVVTVNDTEAPVVVCPANAELELTGSAATVTYDGPLATAADNCDANPVITSVPALPVSYDAAGEYTITWMATDAHGNSSSEAQTITVAAFAELAVSAGPDVTLLCGESSAIGGSPTAVDGKAPYAYVWSPSDGLDDAAIANPVASPLETTTYTVTVTDAEGTSFSDDVVVTVNDAEAPVVVCPDDAVLEITDSSPIVTYDGPPATASDNCDAEPVITSDPELPVSYDAEGEYIITWTATDAQGNSASCDQTITVSGSDSFSEEIADVITDLEDLLTGDRKTDKKLNKAIDKIEKALDPKLWLDDDHLVSKKGKKSFDQVEKAIKELEKLLKDKKIDDSIKSEVEALIADLLLIYENIVLLAIEEARAACMTDRCAKELEKADKAMLQADDKIAKGDFDKAMDKLKKAWVHADKAMRHILGKELYNDAYEFSAEIPEEYTLEQNYPNPFNPTTMISFSLPEDAEVKLVVYNIIGQEIAVLAEGLFSAGNHTFQFDAAGLNAGLYLYRLETYEYTTVKKMILLK